MYKLHITCLLFPFRFSKLDMWSQRVCRSESSPHQSQLSCSQLESGAHQRGQGRCRAGTDLVKCHRGEQRQMKEPFCPLMQQIVRRHCQETQTVRPPRHMCHRLLPLYCSSQVRAAVCGSTASNKCRLSFAMFSYSSI